MMQIPPDPTDSTGFVSLTTKIAISSDPTSCPCWNHAGDKLMHPGVKASFSELGLNHPWLVRQLPSTFTLFSSIGASKSEAAQISFCRHHLIFNIHRVTIYITHLGGIGQGVWEVPCDDGTGCIKNCGGYLDQLCALMARRTPLKQLLLSLFIMPRVLRGDQFAISCNIDLRLNCDEAIWLIKQNFRICRKTHWDFYMPLWADQPIDHKPSPDQCLASEKV